jgi:hypothetical protein
VASTELCDKGAEIIRQERANFQAGLPIGEGTVPSSSSSSDLQVSADTRDRRMGLQQNSSLGRALNRPGPQEFNVGLPPDETTSSRWDAAKSRLTRAVAGGRGTDGLATAGSTSHVVEQPRARAFLDNMFAGFGGGSG